MLLLLPCLATGQTLTFMKKYAHMNGVKCHMKQNCERRITLIMLWTHLRLILIL